MSSFQVFCSQFPWGRNPKELRVEQILSLSCYSTGREPVRHTYQSLKRRHLASYLLFYLIYVCKYILTPNCCAARTLCCKTVGTAETIWNNIMHKLHNMLFITYLRTAVVHLNLRAWSTFTVPDCTEPHGLWIYKADTQQDKVDDDFMLHIFTFTKGTEVRVSTLVHFNYRAEF